MLVQVRCTAQEAFGRKLCCARTVSDWHPIAMLQSSMQELVRMQGQVIDEV